MRVPLKVLDSGSVQTSRDFKAWAYAARKAAYGTTASDKAIDAMQSLVSRYSAFEKGE